MAEREGPTRGDLYAVLGLTPAASSEEIRAAYQRLASDIVAGQASPIQRTRPASEATVAPNRFVPAPTAGR